MRCGVGVTCPLFKRQQVVEDVVESKQIVYLGIKNNINKDCTQA